LLIAHTQLPAAVKAELLAADSLTAILMAPFMLPVWRPYILQLWHFAISKKDQVGAVSFDQTASPSGLLWLCCAKGSYHNPLDGCLYATMLAGPGKAAGATVQMQCSGLRCCCTHCTSTEFSTNRTAQ
jgi:hypothetical protein